MDITSANATLVLSCADFALASVSVEGFAVDDAWSFEETEHVVAQKGVDGKMSAGWVPVLNNMRINFSPDSPFNAQMMALLQAQKAARKPFIISGVLSVPSLDKVFTLSKGVCPRAKTAPDGARVLGPQAYTITFDDVSPAVI